MPPGPRRTTKPDFISVSQVFLLNFEPKRSAHEDDIITSVGILMFWFHSLISRSQWTWKPSALTYRVKCTVDTFSERPLYINLGIRSVVVYFRQWSLFCIHLEACRLMRWGWLGNVIRPRWDGMHSEICGWNAVCFRNGFVMPLP